MAVGFVHVNFAVFYYDLIVVAVFFDGDCLVLGQGVGSLEFSFYVNYDLCFVGSAHE